MLHSLFVRTLSGVPTPILRRLAGRYIAGETLAEELDTLQRLAAEGFPGVLDVLGEHAASEASARAALEEYRRAVDGLAQRGLDAYVSVKPTHFGLLVDEGLALELYRQLARHCRERGLFLRVEMEDHPTIDATLRIFEALRQEFEAVGLVLQSRLFRTPADIDALAPGPLDVRMVKGVYLEPSEIAHTAVEPIREAFVECTRKLLERGAYVRLATHDEFMSTRLVHLLERMGKTRDDYEFQVLLGVREPLWREWHQIGHPVRVYVPFGPNWKDYSLRRMRKNPQLFGAVVRNVFRA